MNDHLDRPRASWARRAPRPVGLSLPPPGSVAVRHVLAVVVLGLLLTAPLVLVIVPLKTVGPGGSAAPVALSSAVVVYSAVHIGAFCWRGRPRWAAGFFWAFSYVWLGLASLAQTYSGLNPMSLSMSVSTQVVQLTMVLVGFMAFDLGQRLHRRTGAMVRVDHGRRVISRGRVLVLGALTLLSTPFLVHAFGGLETLFGSRQAVLDHLTAASLYSDSGHAGGGLVTALANVLPFASAMAILCLWRGRPELRRDPWLIALFAALLIVNLLFNNPISNPRYWFFAIGIAVVLVLPIMKRSTAKVALITLFLVAATVAFPYADAFRNAETGFQNSTRSSSGPADFLIGKTDYGAVTDVGIAVIHVENQGHTWGRQLLGAAAFWVPRGWWADKPPNTAEILAAEIQFPNPNLDTPLWAEGYIDFGLTGTAAVLLGLGVLARRADGAIERAEADPRLYAVAAFPIAVCFVGYESFLLRGSLLQAMAKLAFLVVTLAALGVRPPARDLAAGKGTREPIRAGSAS